MVFDVTLIIILMVVICQLLGSAFLGCCIKRDTGWFDFFIAPSLGLSILVILALVHGWLFRYAMWSSILEVTVLVVISLLLEKKQLSQYPKKIFLLSVSSLIIAAPILMPLAKFDSYNPFTDCFTYLVHGQWLQRYSFVDDSQTLAHHPAWTQVSFYKKNSHRMGASFFLGWIQALFGLEWSYFAYPATVALALIAGAFAVGAAVAEIFPKEKSIMFVATFFTSASFNGFVYGSLYGFLPQTYGLAFATAATVVVGRLLDQSTDHLKMAMPIRLYIPGAVLVAAIFFCYNDMFLFLVFSVMIYLSGTILFKPKDFRQILRVFGVLVFTTIILVNIEFFRAYHNFVQTVTASAHGGQGWPILWHSIEFLAHSIGLRPAFTGNHLDRFLPFLIATTILVISIITVCTVLNQKNWKYSSFSLTISILLAFLVGFVYLRFGISNLGDAQIDNTFIQFKIAKWSSPFFLILIGWSMATIAEKSQYYRKLIYFLSCTLVILGLTANWYVMSDVLNSRFFKSANYERSAFSSLLKLREDVSRIGPDETIYLNLGPPQSKLRQMVTYVLLENKLVGDFADCNYIGPSLHANERSQPHEKSSWVVDHLENNYTQLKSFERYGNLVLRKTPHTMFNLWSVEGDFSSRVDKTKLERCSKDKLGYTYKIHGKVSDAQLSFLYKSDIPLDLTLSIYGNEVFSVSLRADQNWKMFTSPTISLTEDILRIVICKTVDSVGQFSRNDAFCVSDVGFQDSQSGIGRQ